MDDPSARERRLDECLADFTDKVLQEGVVDSPSLIHDPENAELEETILKLKRAVQAAAPDTATEQRIRASLMKEWQNTTSGTARPVWPWKRFIYAAAAVLAVLIITSILLINPDGGQITGTANGGISTPGIIFVWVIVIVALIFWFYRRKK
jgi:hypothetical protein